MNLGIYIGRITKDLELKQTQGGVPYMSFDIAVQRSRKNAQGEYETDFVNCVAFRGTAEFLNNYAQKGYVVAISGKMQDNNYQKEDGTMMYNKQFIVEEVNSTVLFLNKKQEDNNQQQQGGYTQGQQGQQQAPQNNYNQQQGQQQQQQRGQGQPNQNGWQQQQGQQNNPFNNANGPIEINDDSLPF